MRLEISQVRERLRLMDEENAAILSTNSRLIKQLAIVNESLFASETKVESLAQSLQEQYSQEAKVANMNVRAQALEDQINILDLSRKNLRKPVPASVSARQVEARWKQTEDLLDALTKQYESIETEAKSENLLPSLRQEPPLPEVDIQHQSTPVRPSTTHMPSIDLATPSPLPETPNMHRLSQMAPPPPHLVTTEIHHHHHFHVVQTSKQKRPKKVSFTDDDFLPTPPDSLERRHGAQRPLRRVISLPHARTASSGADISDSETCISDGVNSEDEYFDNFPLHQQKNVRRYISYESGLRDLRDQLDLDIDLTAAVAPSSIQVAPPVVGLSTPDSTLVNTPPHSTDKSDALHMHRTKRYSDIGVSEISGVMAECSFRSVSDSSASDSPSLRKSSDLLSAAVANSSRRKSSGTPGLGAIAGETQSLNRKLSSFFTRIKSNLGTPVKTDPDANDDTSLAPPTPSPTACVPSINPTTSTAVPVISPLSNFDTPSSSSPPLAHEPIAASVSIPTSSKYPLDTPASISIKPSKASLAGNASLSASLSTPSPSPLRRQTSTKRWLQVTEV